MNYYINFQGTCWLVQYLNFINENYDEDTFYKLLALNRFLRYRKCIDLIKNKQVLDNKPYLFSQLLNFDGSYLDIEDMLQYEIIGNLSEDLSDEKIFFNNEKTTMLLLKMYENKLDLEEIIFKNFFDLFGNLTFNKVSSQIKHSFITFLPKLKNGRYELINSNFVYHGNKYIYNLTYNPLDIIDKSLSLNKYILISLDLGKSIFINNIIALEEDISFDVLNKFLNSDNHYYIIIDKILKSNKTYYKAFSGYDDCNKFCLIEKKYLKMYINHIICDNIISENDYEIDFFDFEECE